jgi:hypothetical protein
LSQQNRGFLRREDYYTSTQVATKKQTKTAILLGEIESPPQTDSHAASDLYPAGRRTHDVLAQETWTL